MCHLNKTPKMLISKAGIEVLPSLSLASPSSTGVTWGRVSSRLGLPPRKGLQGHAPGGRVRSSVGESTEDLLAGPAWAGCKKRTQGSAVGAAVLCSGSVRGGSGSSGSRQVSAQDVLLNSKRLCPPLLCVDTGFAGHFLHKA